MRDYFAEVASRWYQRPVTEEEIDEGLVEHHSDDLAPPAVVFLVARRDGEPAGCTGLREAAEPGAAEFKRLYVRPEARGSGGGAALPAAAAEAAAREFGADRIVLDTRHDLVEARALYARHGYEEVPAFTTDPYAGHWFAKRLG